MNCLSYNLTPTKTPTTQWSSSKVFHVSMVFIQWSIDACIEAGNSDNWNPYKIHHMQQKYFTKFSDFPFTYDPNWNFPTHPSDIFFQAKVVKVKKLIHLWVQEPICLQKQMKGFHQKLLPLLVWESSAVLLWIGSAACLENNCWSNEKRRKVKERWGVGIEKQWWVKGKKRGKEAL